MGKSLPEKGIDAGMINCLTPPKMEDILREKLKGYRTHTDWESGQVDDYYFEVEESLLLWSPDNA